MIYEYLILPSLIYQTEDPRTRVRFGKTSKDKEVILVRALSLLKREERIPFVTRVIHRDRTGEYFSFNSVKVYRDSYMRKQLENVIPTITYVVNERWDFLLQSIIAEGIENVDVTVNGKVWKIDPMSIIKEDGRMITLQSTDGEQVKTVELSIGEFMNKIKSQEFSLKANNPMILDHTLEFWRKANKVVKQWTKEHQQ